MNLVFSHPFLSLLLIFSLVFNLVAKNSDMEIAVTSNGIDDGVHANAGSYCIVYLFG